MQIEIKIDPSCTEPKVVVLTAAVNEQVERLVGRLREEPRQLLTGSREGRALRSALS